MSKASGPNQFTWEVLKWEELAFPHDHHRIILARCSVWHYANWWLPMQVQVDLYEVLVDWNSEVGSQCKCKLYFRKSLSGYGNATLTIINIFVSLQKLEI